MEQKQQITLEQLYYLVKNLDKKVEIIDDKIDSLSEDEGELHHEFKTELEKRRKTPESEYVSFEEVKKQLKKKK